MYEYQPQPYYADETGRPFPLALQAMMPWTFAGSVMGTGGFEDATWVGGAYYLEYGLMKPIVQYLIDHPPGTAPPIPPPNGDSALWNAIADEVAAIRRGLS
jgi:hypothetical protein